MTWIAFTETPIYDAPNSDVVIGSLAEGQQVGGDLIRLGAWVQLYNGGYVLKRMLRRVRV